MYALYKQATIGNTNTRKWTYVFNTCVIKCNNLKLILTLKTIFEIIVLYIMIIARPGMMDLKGKAKWDAWKLKEGMPQDNAKEAYIKLVNTLIEKYK